MKTDREKVREFDSKYDFKHDDHPNYERESYEHSKDFTKEELYFFAKKMGNNKKVYDYEEDDDDNIHTMMLKECIEEIHELLLIVFNYYKDTADITTKLNQRALNPLTKKKKSHEVIKDFRPLSIEKSTWKLYQMMVDNRNIRYLIKFKIISLSQYAAKKGCGSEDCIIDFAYSIWE